MICSWYSWAIVASLSAFRLGAWQFMADMPYNSVALLTLWQILWTLYHYQLSNHAHRPSRVGVSEERRIRGVSVLLDFTQMPQNAEEIKCSIRGWWPRLRYMYMELHVVRRVCVGYSSRPYKHLVLGLPRSKQA